VLKLLVDGLTNLEIAERLVIGTSTIKKHVSSIFAKLGVTSRSEAVGLAMRHHLIAE
jgi:DNA-binding NarL/FixJ family response regulator